MGKKAVAMGQWLFLRRMSGFFKKNIKLFVKGCCYDKHSNSRTYENEAIESGRNTRRR